MMLFASRDVKYKFISHILHPTSIVYSLLTNKQVVMFGDWGGAVGQGQEHAFGQRREQ
jgi:hypothetical protein